MSQSLVVIGLLALAGFLLGGVYSTWKTARGLSVVLAVLALMAVGGAVAWFV
ncbi:MULTISPECIES: hypothetical protein [Saccharothrix]|uniref:hypothetical protein n=1 Tax=Saccharothrix TaxID=2071 RepID=UPI0027D3206B|nr:MULTISPECIES: hypothetical protein [Saccharothrix]MBY8848498.1 hypothetical protein [Saccharothrix sp. MB29]MDU0292109.1 hypothetical protein [Saccharothrix longispora]